MVEKSKEFLETFDPSRANKENVKRNYENYIKNRENGDKLYFTLDKINKERIIAMHGNRCVICGSRHHGNKLEIHHVIPKSEGGTNEVGNLIPLCHTCHCAVHKINDLNPYGMNMLRRVVDKIGEIA